jgi:hypothetical protein
VIIVSRDERAPQMVEEFIRGAAGIEKKFRVYVVKLFVACV